MARPLECVKAVLKPLIENGPLFSSLVKRLDLSKTIATDDAIKLLSTGEWLDSLHAFETAEIVETVAHFRGDLLSAPLTDNSGPVILSIYDLDRVSLSCTDQGLQRIYSICERKVIEFPLKARSVTIVIGNIKELWRRKFALLETLQAKTNEQPNKPGPTNLA